jgi:hypothetical protein
MKKVLVYLIAVAICFPFNIPTAKAAVANSYDNAYQGIVKIYLFSLNEDGFLEKQSSGSGIFIDESGIILSNHHVVTQEDSFDKSPMDVAYQICLTENKNNEPNCTYTARLIASDKDKDLALLRIQSINGFGTKDTFPYLELADKSIENGASITILGYPGVGGKTITINQGVVSGKVEKHNLSWIKTDADISFGNSGGAGINQNGQVIGIPTQAHSDMLGSVGYLLDIASINDWVNSNKNLSSTASPLELRLGDFTKIEENIKTSNDFTIIYPAVKISKDSSWEFDYSSEQKLSIHDEDDNDSGIVNLSMDKLPYIASDNDVDWIFETDYRELLGMVKIVKKESISIGSKTGYLITHSFMGSVNKKYYIAHGNYIIKIGYDYGENDKDKNIVDKIIASIQFDNYSPVINSLHSYNNSFHGFNLNFDSQNWIGESKYSLNKPVHFYHKDYKNIQGDILVEKIDGSLNGLSNNELHQINMDEISDLNTGLKSIGGEIKVLKSASYANLGKNINNALMREYKISMESGFLLQALEYKIIHAGKVFTISISQLGNGGDFEKAKNDFIKLFSSFELNSYQAAKVNEEIINYQADGSTNTEKAMNSSQVSTDQKTDNTTKKLTIKNQTMHARLKGKIMLKVEDAGKAYYIHPKSQEMHYLGRPADAFAVMREQGVGISNTNLEKIPIGSLDIGGKDTDGDGLSDAFEDAIGTDKYKADTDGDGYNDKDELKNGYSPVLKLKKLVHDNRFGEQQKGMIFLQVEKRGEAWYINPADGKRYFLGRPEDAFSVMRNLGLGISNGDFNSMQ